MLTDELHIHLYGCLSASDLWLLGRERYKAMAPRLAWYAKEYSHAYGRTPDVISYWTKDDGCSRLRRDFEFTEHGSFRQFQASFNLAIALFPGVPGDTMILEHVLKAQRSLGLRYGEYRCFVPQHLSSDQITAFAGAAADATAHIARESAGQYKPRLAFSLSRKPELGTLQHQAIRAALRGQPERQLVITGLDFCGVEAGHPPAPMAGLFQEILTANQREPASALAILYHVGESFDDMSVMSAMRWIWQAHQLGAHRLGHATALGLNLTALAGTSVCETKVERLAHLAWLEEQANWLGDRGYRFDLPQVQAERMHLTKQTCAEGVRIDYDGSTLAAARSLQNALLEDLAQKGAVVESCPSSNLRIGQIADPRHHPLIRFVAAGLTTVVSSDDPGIFAVDLAHEERVCREQLLLSQSALERLQATNSQVRSELLTKRPHC